MKFVLSFFLVSSTIAVFSQAVEVEQNPPAVKVLDNNGDTKAEIGYYNQNGGQIKLYTSSGDESITINGGQDQDRFGSIRLYDENGNETIALFGEFGQENRGRIQTDQLEITGGADLAEYFHIKETYRAKPGMLVSINPSGTGDLQLAKMPYDKNIVGVISGANGIGTGMFMGQSGSVADGDYPIALTGRAYVLSNEQGGAINPGDLLTSSNESGYAMKAKKSKKARGAIIGKAMSTPDENGFVLVLISLQ